MMMMVHNQTNAYKFQTLEDNTYTLRDRDTTKQVRAGIDEVCEAIAHLVNGTESWEDVAARLPAFESQDAE